MPEFAPPTATPPGVALLRAPDFCDSAGARAIVLAPGHARSRGAELRIVVRSAQVKRLFEITSLDSIVRIYPDAASALIDA